MQIARVDAQGVLNLSGALRIHVVEDLRSALLEYVSTTSILLVDLSQVTECDAAGLQMLASARRYAEHSGKPFQLAGAPEAVQEAGAALGLPVAALSSNPVAGVPGARDGSDARPANGGCDDAV